MYLGYQINDRTNKEFLAHIAETKEDLLKICTIFSKIDSTEEPVELIDGCFYIGDTIEKAKLMKLSDVIRKERNIKLTATDHLITSDYPIEPNDLIEVKTYRQALRDLPQQEGFPKEIHWPETPNIIKR